MRCPRCNCSRMRRMGKAFRGGKKYQRWQCNECGATHVEGATRPEWLIKEQKARYG